MVFEAERELFKFYKDGLSQILNGVVLRNKRVSKAGRNSAVIFVPSYLLGQKVKIVIIPEDTEIIGYRSSIAKKAKRIHQLTEQIKKIGAEVVVEEEAEADAVKAAEEKKAEDVPVGDPTEEDEDGY